ncbi:hypothetical protein GCM10028862_03330 [Luteimonas pelagia]
MDYFQGVVTEYLRADRAVFVNTECLLRLDNDGEPKRDRHWYCDALAVNIKEKKVYLCEVTYSRSMQALVQRLRLWAQHWPDLCAAIQRDSVPGESWSFQPWIFIPRGQEGALLAKLGSLPPSLGTASSWLRITYLEEVLPWRYSTWDRRETALAEISSALDHTDVSPAAAAAVLEVVAKAPT